MNIQQDIPLAPFTNWRVGGPADYFVEALTENDLIEAVAFARTKKFPFVILGGGTNVLVADKGFRGLVIRNKMGNSRIVAHKGKTTQDTSADTQSVYLSVDAGVLTNRVVRFTLDNAFSGIENFLGQPGSVGGAVYINAHNMDQHDFFGDHIVEARLMEEDGTIKTVPVDYFHFGYDESSIQQTKETVLSATLRLTRSDKKKVWEKAEKAMQYRHTTQPKGIPTAGCTFRNISAEDAARIKIPKGIRSAGYLIDRAGLKGMRVGNAKISEEHANFILNLGDATADDIKKLIEKAKDAVYDKYGIDLQEEVVLIGEF